MLREKLKWALLRPLLLLAALLALAQPASAWKNYRVRSAGGDNDVYYKMAISQNLTWKNNCYECELTVTEKCGFKIIASYDDDNNDHGWWGPTSETTFNGNNINNLPIQESNSKLFILNPGKYKISVGTQSSAQGNTPNILTITRFVTFPAGMTIYFKPNADFTQLGTESFRAVFDSNKYVLFSKLGTTGYWSATVPASGFYQKVKVERGPANEAVNGNGWYGNCTVELRYEEGKNCIQMADNVSDWSEASASWTTYNAGGGTTTQNPDVHEATSFYMLAADNNGTQKWTAQFYKISNDPEIYEAQSQGDFTGTWNDYSKPVMFYVYSGSTKYYFNDIKDKTNISEWSYDNSKWFQPDEKTRPYIYLWIENGKPVKISSGKKMPSRIPAEALTFKPKGDGPYYFLAGHCINNRQYSPEWQLMPTGDGKYTLDFTFNDHSSNSFDAFPNFIGVASFENATATAAAAYAGRDLTKELESSHGGYRYRAVFNPEAEGDDMLSFIGLVYDRSSKAWREAAAGEKPTLFPFISLVGKDWKQPIPTATTPTTIANEPNAKYASTTLGWQNAWVQYDADGNLITSTDGKMVYYNTQWPPLNPVMLTSTYLTSKNETATVTIGSDELRFTPFSNEVQTGAQWKTEKIDGVDFSNVTLEDTRSYRVYVVDDVWVNGRFKFWSGWSGARWTSGDAEWDKNWNWGHEEMQGSTTADTALKPFVIDGTTILGNANGDMYFAKPQYFSHIYFFADVEEPNGVKRSRVYTKTASGGAQIQALSSDGYDYGIMIPALTNLTQGNTVTEVKITTHLYSTDAEEGEIFSATGLAVGSNNDFQSLFSDYEVEQDGYLDKFEYSRPGYYYYLMTVKFGNSETVTVRSNPYYVGKVSTRVFAGQLIKTGENTYTTYRANSSMAYNVVLGQGNAVESVSSVTALTKAQLEDAANTWTDMLFVYAVTPEVAHVVENSESYTLTVGGSNVTSTTFGGNLATVVPMSSLSEVEILSVYSYKVDMEGADAQEMESRGNTKAQLLVPTPRLGAYWTAAVTNSPATDFSVAADHHTGLAAGMVEGEARSYDAVRARNLAVSVPVEAPNATADLLALLPTDGVKVAFTGHDDLMAYLNDGATYNMKQAGDAAITFHHQDIEDWIEYVEGEGYQAIPLSLSMSAKAPEGVKFYVRASSTTANVDPHFEAPIFGSKTQAADYYIYRSFIQKEKDGEKINSWQEKLYLVRTPEITPGTSKIGGANLDINTEVAHYAFFVTVDYDTRDRHLLSTGHVNKTEMIGTTGVDGRRETNAMLHHSGITTDVQIYELASVDLGLWFKELLDQAHIVNPTVTITASHSYFFDLQGRGATGTGALAIAAPANAPQRAASHNTGVAFAPKGSGTGDALTFNAGEITTAVEMIPGTDVLRAVAGYGFIDMLGTEGYVYSADGRMVYHGSARVELPAGIYMIAQPGFEGYKLIVR